MVTVKFYYESTLSQIESAIGVIECGWNMLDSVDNKDEFEAIKMGLSLLRLAVKDLKEKDLKEGVKVRDVTGPCAV